MIASLIFPFLLTFAFAAEWKVGSGRVEFLSIGNPGFMKIRGESQEGLTGHLRHQDGKLTGEFRFLLSALKTGISLRDQHMKEKYLEVQKYPEAILVVDPLPMTQFSPDQDQSGTFTGKLSLHGVTQPINGTYTYAGTDRKVNCRFSVEIEQFQIPVPSYMGVTVSKTSDVHVEFKLQ